MVPCYWFFSCARHFLAVAVKDPSQLSANGLVVTYACRTGFRSKSYDELAESGAKVARAHYESWSGRQTVVQTVFSANDLPVTFAIDIPIPMGKYPVYPRMLYLSRDRGFWLTSGTLARRGRRHAAPII